MNGLLRVLGTGIVTGRGRGWESQAGAETVPSCDTTGMPRIYRVPSESLSDRVALRKLRRADRFTKMAALSSWDAVAEAGISSDDAGTDVGIVVTTAFGPHQTTFEFLDEVLDFGDAGVSPTRFSHSVHNAAAAYIAIMLGGRGPACTLADFERPLYAGLCLASVWLREERCARVLVTYTEESSAAMEYIATTRRAEGAGRFVQPFHFAPDPEALLSEGSLCLVLARSGDEGRVLDPARFDGRDKIADIGAFMRYWTV